MSLELSIITAREFVRLGAHGETDWNESRALLATLVRTLVERGAMLALLDVRDATTTLNDQQIVALADVFRQSGFSQQQRLAILHTPRPSAKADVFAIAAVLRGFDVASFDDFESAVEWLSSSRSPDPDFDRPIYRPKGKSAEPPAV